MGRPAKAQPRSFTYSPSLLNSYLECEHLLSLELRVTRGELERPQRDNAQAELIRRKGEEHESAYLRELEAQGKQVVEARDTADTERLIRKGSAEVIFQAVFE